MVIDIDKEASEIAQPFQELAAPLGNTPVAPAHGIAAIALSMAMKYYDMSMVKDGALYQQFKLEGRNIRTIGLADVFETAILIEAHLLGASDRIAKLVVDALVVAVDDDELTEGSESSWKSGANGMVEGDRVIYEIDGQHGVAGEFTQDGDCDVTFDHGSTITVKWNNLRKE